ncbi:MAG: GAF domain-containing sensor histidine kinase [Chloroflexota bacterium]
MSLITIAAAVTALAYVGLLAYAIIRIGKTPAAEYWLAGYCLWSAIMAGALALDGLGVSIMDFAPGIWLAMISLGGMCVLGALTFSYLTIKWSWAWLPGMLPLIALVFVLDTIDPNPGLMELTWRAALPSISLAAIGSVTMWGFTGFVLIIITFLETSKARLPLHANRGLWWVAVLPLIMVAEAAAMWAPELVSAIGQVMRVVGVIGLVYGVTTKELVDVRGMFRGVMGNAVFVIVTALVTLLGIGAAFYLLELYPGGPGQIAVAVLALVLALIYQAVRTLLGQVVQETVLKAGYDTAQTSADYSKRIAQILDVGELAAAVGRVLTQSVEAIKSALILLTPDRDNTRAEVFVGSGQMPTVGQRLAASNIFLAHLSQTRKPLLQYTLEVNETFKPMLTIERRWLQRLGMDVYVPVMDGDVLSGILAVGPRKSRDPYRTRELELLSALADQTSVALKNARLVSNLKTSNEEVRALNETLAARHEQLKEMDKVKTDFITIASHELRTPLTQILGFTDLLKMMSEAESVAGKEIAPITESVLKASSRLGEVVTQMLDVSQLDVDAMQLKLTETTVEAALRMAVEPFAAAIRERRLTFTVQNIRNLPHVQADAQRLSQALGQIVGNAIKFTPDSGNVEVRGRHIVNDSKYPESVEIVVTDSGVGINPKYLELIFEKFFRIGSTALHSTGTTKFMGAGPGLGLPIAKGIIEAHGGRVWAESPGFDKDKLPGTKILVILLVKPPALTGKGVPAFIGMEAKQ